MIMYMIIYTLVDILLYLNCISYKVKTLVSQYSDC